MRGRKPYTTGVHDLRGGRPKGRKGEPKVEPGMPTEPAGLSDEAREVWRDAAEILLEMGVLTPADGLALELFSTTFAQWREKPNLAHAARLQSMLSDFGLTPSSRSKVKSHVEKKGEGYSALRERAELRVVE